MHSDVGHWLKLWRAPGIGPRRFRKLLDSFPTLADVFSASALQLQAFKLTAETLSYLKNPDERGVENDLKWADQPNRHILTWQHPAYPRLLLETPAPPPILYVLGHIDSLQNPQLAMVGSRNPSASGQDTAHQFAKHLTKNGFTITSGLALGIDTASHQGALAAPGTTIAVLGTGIDHIYPARNRQLAEHIIESGAIISEFPLGIAALAKNFPRRNRIISGLSVGVLVVEAALQSGSLITARYATEQNRAVFAIPGSIHNPLAKGCHKLLREGAKLVEKAEDILEECGSLIHYTAQPYPQKINENYLETLDPDQQKLVKSIGFETTPIDMIVDRSGFAAENVSAMLMELELKGVVETVAGGYQVCK